MALATPPPQIETAVDHRRWKWTGDDLIKLGVLGALPRERKYELLDGEIIEQMPPGPLHDALVGVIASRLGSLTWRTASHVRQEKAIRLDPYYDPRPDVSLIRGTDLDYTENFPTAVDAVLVLEVADSSVEFDRGEKLRAYAAAGIADYWIVNLRDTQVEVYREPDAQGYRSLRIYKQGETVTALDAPETPLPVSALLGRR